LSKSKEDDQLVKHKDIGLYLQLYIPIDHEERERYLWEKQWGKHKENENMKRPLLLHKVLTNKLWREHKI